MIDKNKKVKKEQVVKSKELSLEEKFKNYKGPNLAKEFEWDKPRGKERKF